MTDLNGKRFLITHSIVHQIMGSTVVALDLATYLQQEGASVLVYAAFIDEPAASFFRDRGIDVVDDEGIAGFRLADVDYVWVNSQVIPEALVDQLAAPRTDLRPQFIFHHMSSLPYAPDEQPYIHQLEERLASLTTFMSTATRVKLLPYFASEMATAIHPNPAPREFSARPYRPKAAPTKVLIVSNHAAPELLEAAELLRAQGLDVRRFGVGRDEYGLVTAETLDGVDVVVTIGKTVQYCLVAGRPVYVYDHFGGYGYLNDENVAYAAHRNYSGRGGRRLTAQAIVEEIVGGYADAVEFHAARREQFVDTYSIDRVVPRLLGVLDPRQVEPFEESYRRVIRSAQHFGARYYRTWGYAVNLENHRDHLIGELAGAHHQRDVAQDELAAVRRSWSYRLGNFLLRPVSLLKRLISGQRSA